MSLYCKRLKTIFFDRGFNVLDRGHGGGEGAPLLKWRYVNFQLQLQPRDMETLMVVRVGVGKLMIRLFHHGQKYWLDFYWRSIKRKKCLVAPIQTDIGDDGSHRINSLKTEQDRGRTVAVDKRLHLYFIFEEQTPKLSIHASLNCPCIQEPTSHMLLRKRRR